MYNIKILNTKRIRTYYNNVPRCPLSGIFNVLYYIILYDDACIGGRGGGHNRVCTKYQTTFTHAQTI